MDYLESLPPDVLRQTALSMDPADVFELSLDPKFEKILNENFWKEKLKINKFEPRDPDIINIYDYELQEPAYNEFLYKYYRFLQENAKVNIQYFYDIISPLPQDRNNLEELERMKRDLDISINILKFADKVKERLIKIRPKSWPKLYTEMNMPGKPRLYDAIDKDKYLSVKAGPLKYIKVYKSNPSTKIIKEILENKEIDIIERKNRFYGHYKAILNQLYLI